MRLQELKPAEGSTRKRKRVGRGSGSGHGKTSCRGHKGQNCRSGGGVRLGFEGGQMPLQRRLPKRGFKNPFHLRYVILNVGDIEKSGLDAVSPEHLVKSGAIKSVRDGLKILGDGTLSRAVTVRAHAFSKSALEKIKSVGGTVEVI